MSYPAYAIYVLVFGLLIFQFYIRYVVVKSYQKLSKQGVNLRFKDVFDKEHVEEVASKHKPSVRQEIYRFVANIRRTFSVSMVIMVLLLIFGFILLKMPSA